MSKIWINQIKNQKLLTRIGIIALAIGVFYPVLIYVNHHNLTIAAPTLEIAATEIVTTPELNTAIYNEKLSEQTAQAAHIANESSAERQRAAKIAIAKNFLSSRNSPMTNFAHIIVDAAVRCGGDYKVMLALAEVESSSGKHPYKKYNPYGYLNGVQYTSWSSALDKLTCLISRQYGKFGNNFTEMGKIYATSSTWPQKMAKVYAKI